MNPKRKTRTIQSVYKKYWDNAQSNSNQPKTKEVIVFTTWGLVFSIIVSSICFMWNNCMNVQFIPGNLSKTKIITEVPFEFESKVKTNRLREQKKRQARNVYEINEKKYDNFIKTLKFLDERMECFSYENVLSERGRNDIKEFVNEFNAASPIKVEWQDVALLVSSLDQIERTQIFQECVSMLREIAHDGVFYDDSVQQSSINASNLYGFRIKGRQQQHVRTQEGALHYMRMHLLSLDLDKDIVTILFKILKQGVKPNLVYDPEESKIDMNLIVRSVKPVIVRYDVGDIILEQNVVINQESYESLIAYQKALKSASNKGYGLYDTFFSKSFLALIATVIVFLGIKVTCPKIPILTRKRFFILACLTIFQLIILRLFTQFGELDIFIRNFTLIHALYCIAPFMFAPAMATLLFGAVYGLIVSVITVILYTLMLSRPIDFCLVILVTCLSLVTLLENVKLKSKIFVCSLYAGVVFAISIITHGIFTQLDNRVMLLQVGSAFLMAFLTAILTVTFFPFFEHIFSEHTDISLLKLTDYANPLLQQLQLIAPGTYQHSLVVSNLSEQVAGSIKANKVICKAAALFHDIGKINKPEYFIENQSNHINLHDQQTPYISSLIIRNHVKEGVSLAEIAKLPKIVIDIIREHHGTTVTQFFYDKACSEVLNEIDKTNMTQKEIDRYLKDKVDKSSFRYDGPRPRTKESAIVMLSDSIEAASRSLKKVTHQNIENLVDIIFFNKISDHQLDECPITLDELRTLKKAFSFTLLSMLHSRINYSNNDFNTKKV